MKRSENKDLARAYEKLNRRRERMGAEKYGKWMHEKAKEYKAEHGQLYSQSILEGFILWAANI